MNESDKPPVRKERSGFRDEEISAKHRLWGWDCPAIDIDFLMLEYDTGEPLALIEYKRFTAPIPDITGRSYEAIAKLANYAQIPFAMVIYWPDIWAFKVRPVNQFAAPLFKRRCILTEVEYLTLLYQLRNREIPQDLAKTLHTEIPH